MRVLPNGLAASFTMQPLVSRIVYRYFCTIATKDSVVVKVLEYRNTKLVDSDITIHRTSNPAWTSSYVQIKALFDSVKLVVLGGRIAGTIFNMDRATFYAPTGIGNSTSSAQAGLFPNPIHGTATFRFHNPEHKPYRWLLTNAIGQAVMLREDLRNEEMVIERGNLAPGTYYWQLRAADGSGQVTGRLVVE